MAKEVFQASEVKKRGSLCPINKCIQLQEQTWFPISAPVIKRTYLTIEQYRDHNFTLRAAITGNVAGITVHVVNDLRFCRPCRSPANPFFQSPKDVMVSFKSGVTGVRSD